MPLSPEDAARSALASLADAVLADEIVVESERVFLRRRALQLGVSEERADTIVAEALQEAAARCRAGEPTESGSERKEK
jgi:hypothetical protein